MRNRVQVAAPFVAALLFALPAPAQPAVAPQPPKAKVVPQRLEQHAQVRIDNYYWLNDRSNPEVIAYLEAENVYTAQAMKHTEALQETLFNEMVGRLKQDDASVPYLDRGVWYYTRFAAGGNYALYCRKKGKLSSREQVMLDANQLATGQGYFSVTGVEVAADDNTLAFATDTVGRRFYTIRFKDLRTGALLADTIKDVTGNLAWANDSRTLFYTRQDPATLRSHRVFRHELGTDPANDTLVFEETDETYSVRVARTKSRRFILIASNHTLADEVRFVDADRPREPFRVFLPRERGHEYSIDHLGDRFYVRTNAGAKNFKLVSTPVAATGRENWRDVIAHRDDVYLSDFELFRDFLVAEERRNGLTQLRVLPFSGSGEHTIDFGEPTYGAGIGVNREPDTTVLRYTYTSLTTPNSVYDYDMVTRTKKLMKRDEVLGGFDPANYASERLWAPARDGARVPISIVYRKEFKRDGSGPLLLYGYGSYGASTDAFFHVARLSLLDRGFAVALAHIRGGSELGRDWYENGKLLRKKNTFTDFIDCAEYLVREKYTSADRLFAQGGSAGGLLIGAVVNLRPDLFKGAVAQVPFVDVITTMLDSSIPLTTSEYDEWGDPKKEEYYDYMMTYSPYDNVVPQAYPHLLVTTGLHDSQVQYWEPAKWVAKLRAVKTDDHRLLLHANMEAGHGGTSGRLRRFRDTALVYAFVLDLAGAGR
jgi:oligopeptidase B